MNKLKIGFSIQSSPNRHYEVSSTNVVEVQLVATQNSYSNSITNKKPPFCAGAALHMTSKPPVHKTTLKSTKYFKQPTTNPSLTSLLSGVSNLKS